MSPENVVSSFLIGDNLEEVLFKTAIYYAERGLKVWFISPESINNVPESINTPETDVLKLITFLYLENYEALLQQLNGLHLWHKKPSMIILNGFEKYCNLNLSCYNSLLTASICASLIDNASCCNKDSKTFVLVAISVNSEFHERLKVLVDMYINNVILMSDSIDNEIINFFNVG